MTKKSDAPAIRFKGFSDAWEQRKLGELVDVCSGRDYKHLSEGTIPVYGTGGYMLSVNDALSYDRDAIGIGRKGTIDRPYILKAPFWTVDTLFYAIPREKVDLNYAFDIFQNIDWKKKDESTGVPSLSKTAINDIDVLAPKHDEQQIIGQFFAAIDNLITLHQRECISFTGRADRLILTANKKRTTSSWEQRKLGELVDVCSGRDYKHLSEGTIPVYGTGGYMLSVNDALSYDRDAIGIGRKGTIDRPYILKAPFWTVDTLFYAIPREKVDLNYAFDIFQNIDWKKKDESTGVPSLSKTAINDIDVLAPKHDEQQIIGQFFAAIDNLITLHQRKFEKLKNVKKSMLEKMFPQNGSSYPEIRFKGFTDPWEQRKFGEVFMSLQNNTLSRAELNDEIGAAQNIHYGDVLIKYDEILDVSKEPLSYIEKQSIADKFKTSYLQNGDVIIADTAEDETVGKCTEIEGLTDQKVISGLHTMPVRPNRKFAFGFLGFYLNSAAYHDQLKPLMQGIKVTSISKGAMQDTVVKFPLDLKEQEQIGIYFGGLDNLITLHQRELEKLQNIKKSMLEKMFV